MSLILQKGEWWTINHFHICVLCSGFICLLACLLQKKRESKVLTDIWMIEVILSQLDTRFLIIIWPSINRPNYLSFILIICHIFSTCPEMTSTKFKGEKTIDRQKSLHKSVIAWKTAHIWWTWEVRVESKWQKYFYRSKFL